VFRDLSTSTRSSEQTPHRTTVRHPSPDVPTPHVGLSRYSFCQLVAASRREIRRDQAVLYGSNGRSVHRNLCERPQRVYEHLQASVLLSRDSKQVSLTAICQGRKLDTYISFKTVEKAKSFPVRPDTSVPRTLFSSEVSSRPRSALPRSEDRIAG
jgi:hypothetical protein